MITRVQIKNINAIEYCDISFEKAKYQYLEDMIYHEKLVNPIAFYGTNGSGKSSFLRAFSQLIRILTDEVDKIRNFIVHQYNVQKVEEPYINKQKEFNEDELYAEYNQIRSSITVTFLLDNKEFIYFIETSLMNRITAEQLSVNGNHVFDRTEHSYIYNNERYEIESTMYSVLRKLANEPQKSNMQISKAYEFLSNMVYVDDHKQIYLHKKLVEKSYLDIIVDKSQEVKEILSKYKEFPLYDVFSKPNINGGKNYYASIDIGNKIMNLPYSLLSAGMQHQSSLLSIILLLPENSTMFVDEIEDALHPFAVLDLINVAKEKNIHLIFSSHNTFILQKLRPDQIFFANWQDGYSTYKKLSDIYPNIREVNNIEKMYLSDLFNEDIKKDE